MSVTILNVDIIEADERLWGSYIDFPFAGAVSAAHDLAVQGWALGRSAQVMEFQLSVGRTVVRRLPPNVQRDDLRTAWPTIDLRCGFDTAISTIGLGTEFAVGVRAVLRDGDIVPLARIVGTRTQAEPVRGPRLSPIVLTTLGRSGSTWLAQLLAAHPSVYCVRPFEADVRAASYWAQLFMHLSDPARYRVAVTDSLVQGDLWWMRPATAPVNSPDDVDLDQWLGTAQVAAVARFCQERLDDLYSHLMGATDAAVKTHFLEKSGPGRVQGVLDELYESAGEVVLVRDPRDIVASMLAFNARRGYAAFGRELTDTDVAFVRRLADDVLGLLDHWRSRSHRATAVRYEDLVAHPVRTIHRLFAQLGLDASEVLAERCVNQAAQIADSAGAHRTSSDPGASVGRWVRDLSLEVQEEVEKQFGGMLEEFGYTDGVAGGSVAAVTGQGSTPGQA